MNYSYGIAIEGKMFVKFFLLIALVAWFGTANAYFTIRRQDYDDRINALRESLSLFRPLTPPPPPPPPPPPTAEPTAAPAPADPNAGSPVAVDAANEAAMLKKLSEVSAATDNLLANSADPEAFAANAAAAAAILGPLLGDSNLAALIAAGPPAVGTPAVETPAVEEPAVETSVVEEPLVEA